MIETIVGLIAAALGISAEYMRRKWQQADERATKNEERIKELQAQRDAAWRDGNLGGVFNSDEQG